MAVDVNALVVTGTGRKMHLAKTREREGVTGVSGPPNASTLCGRLLWEVYAYPLAEEKTLPWDLCRECAKKRQKIEISPEAG